MLEIVQLLWIPLHLLGKFQSKTYILLTGTYRYGLQQAPFWGNYMVNLITQNDNQFEHPFNPERKLLSTIPNQHEAIKEVVYIAGFYEHSMHLARLFPEQKLENMLYDKFAAIYHKLDTTFPMKPDILFLFEISDSNDENIEFFKQYFKDVL